MNIYIPILERIKHNDAYSVGNAYLSVGSARAFIESSILPTARKTFEVTVFESGGYPEWLFYDDEGVLKSRIYIACRELHCSPLESLAAVADG